jgi:hypothetical protein
MLTGRLPAWFDLLVILIVVPLLLASLTMAQATVL